MDDGKNRDHDFFFFVHHGQRSAVFTKLSRGTKYKDIGDHLLALIAKQLKISRSDLNRLIDCPMSQEEYTTRLIEQKVLQA